MAQVLVEEITPPKGTRLARAYLAAESGSRSQAGCIPAVTGKLALKPTEKGQVGENHSIEQSLAENSGSAAKAR